MLLKYTLFWIPMVFIAVINGMGRDMVYRDIVGELTAHQISTVTGILLFGIYIWYLERRWKLASLRQAALVGAIWLALTLAFEFLFFHYAAGRPWSVLLHDYNICAGRIWVLVPLFILAAPGVIFRIQSRSGE